MKEISIKLKI